MRILITDRHTSNSDLEQEAVGTDIEIEGYDNPEDVPDEAWARADGIVTYRGTKWVTVSYTHLTLPTTHDV